MPRENRRVVFTAVAMVAAMLLVTALVLRLLPTWALAMVRATVMGWAIRWDMGSARASRATARTCTMAATTMKIWTGLLLPLLPALLCGPTPSRLL
ncbi:hypothetical protein F5Y17DRAFT_447840 [Xylariaceae sp. FL0594]|nr:hypothetical protein F5Y17DRAFT_447840 [Xylariaceae sp. FL0594]